MGLGAGVNKESLLLYLCGYLILLSIVIVMLQTEMHLAVNNNMIIPSTDRPTFIDGLWNMFTGFFNWPADVSFVPYIITIPFIWMPKFGIGVILGSYVKDML